jgi:hypothetical protein
LLVGRWLIFQQDTVLESLPNYRKEMSAREFFAEVYPDLGSDNLSLLAAVPIG